MLTVISLTVIRNITPIFFFTPGSNKQIKEKKEEKKKGEKLDMKSATRKISNQNLMKPKEIGTQVYTIHKMGYITSLTYQSG